MLLNIKKDNGATAIEYGLITALIGLLIIGGLSISGTSLSKVFCTVSVHLGSSSFCSENNNSQDTSSYSGPYSSDVNTLLTNLENREKAYIAAWNALNTQNKNIAALRNNNQNDEANNIANSSDYQTLQANEKATYAALQNGNNTEGDYGLTSGLNQIFSTDKNNSITTSGDAKTQQIFSNISNLTYIGKSYTLGDLNSNNGNTYINDLNSVYPN
mgnify:CR=1 FL=1